MQFKLPGTAREAERYEKIAAFYDYLMRHVNYERWYEYLQSLLQTYALKADRVLEMACGTGVLLEKFVKDGWQASGFDLSKNMLAAAKKRLFGYQPQPSLWVGDMRQFAISRKVDVAICLYDSVNYCILESEVAATLDGVHEALAKHGLFIFDVVTIRNCKTHFLNFYERDFVGELEYIRQAHFQMRSNKQINEFRIISHAAGKKEISYERHVQRIYPLHELKGLVSRSGRWEILGIFDNFSRRPGTEKSDRVHFVVRKL